MLSSLDSVGGLHGNAVEEELQPFSDLASFADILEAIVVVALALIEVAGEVQQRSGQPSNLQLFPGKVLGWALE